ncbi:sporulation protein [Lysobacter sp. TY2-98]|uniref:SPOR domain-containing protein n=1 Tax=Lysobacter sp. TY2-98 TaxID=2290922 RepID=UPI000E1FB8CD|nr:SPOR domain-containing protein [Lysobacter sp. TY2-98]AXK73023.1 sporulation protein [Lysobacter sp. TY2-98]
MAQKRGKTQARRSGGGGGGGSMPGWAWLVIGVAITLLVVLAAPRLMHRDKDGFFRPTPNPDALPKPADGDDAVVDDEAVDDKNATPKAATAPADDAKKKQDFDFYTLLPGKEVPMTDAELAASEQAEKAQKPAPTDPTPAPSTPAATATATSDTKPLPPPIDESAPKPASTDSHAATAPSAATTAAAPADTHYILQAGAFQASGQAEELKAKIALLGLGARVESAQISGKTVYRVRMGPYGSASELAEAKRKLASGGLSAMAVKTN